MYAVLTVKIPGCVAISLPVQRRNLPKRRFQRLSGLSGASASRAADRRGGFKPERRPFPGHSLFQGRFDFRSNRLSGLKTPIRRLWRALWRKAKPSAIDKAAFLPLKITQTGRRLMRQTVLPALQGKISPMRGASRARRCRSPETCSARRSTTRFGLPLTPESGGPSRQPAVQLARAALRARRRQELQNAQQDAYRCHPPGGDPGRRGPRQSRRRI
jgi:hypothetical protein